VLFALYSDAMNEKTSSGEELCFENNLVKIYKKAILTINIFQTIFRVCMCAIAGRCGKTMMGPGPMVQCVVILHLCFSVVCNIVSHLCQFGILLSFLIISYLLR
jgi:hypothetical protein